VDWSDDLLARVTAFIEHLEPLSHSVRDSAEVRMKWMLNYWKKVEIRLIEMRHADIGNYEFIFRTTSEYFYLPEKMHVDYEWVKSQLTISPPPLPSLLAAGPTTTENRTEQSVSEPESKTEQSTAAAPKSSLTNGSAANAQAGPEANAQKQRKAPRPKRAARDERIYEIIEMGYTGLDYCRQMDTRGINGLWKDFPGYEKAYKADARWKALITSEKDRITRRMQRRSSNSS
jgi:hypothetical protein